MKNIKKHIKNSLFLYSICYTILKILSYIISDELYIKIKFKKTFRRNLNLDNPQTFNEKIQWRILKERKSEYTEFADKYLVRDYIKDKIGEQYLIKLLGVYSSSKDIDYEKLPNKFVLKCNHDSGSVVICKDKATLDKKSVNHKLDFYLKKNFYYQTREWHYKDIKPKIICEELLEDIKELYDYKFHCFEGKVEIIQVANNSHTGNNMYTKEWELLPFTYLNKNYDGVQKPKNIKEMIRIAEKLAEDFNYVRIDLYESNSKIYFGEITFTSNGGFGKFNPESWDYYYGKKIRLEGLNEKNI